MDASGYPITIQDSAQLALHAERENDIAILLDELHSIIPTLRRDAPRAMSISQHPIVRLYVDQMHHLSHKCLNGHALEKHLKAVEECKKIAYDAIPEERERPVQLTLLELA